MRSALSGSNRRQGVVVVVVARRGRDDDSRRERGKGKGQGNAGWLFEWQRMGVDGLDGLDGCASLGLGWNRFCDVR